uniref:Transposase n=1 Tax=Oncorhynchus tshawytscha TaxID=74940 RepID=A0AAZ3QD20_ONCTS
MGTKMVLFGEISFSLMKQKGNCLAIMTIVIFGGKRGRLASPKKTITTMKHGGGSIKLWGCFAAGGTGALHKIDGIMRNENYVVILKQPLKISVRKLKLGRKWVFHMDNDPKHTSKVVAKWPKFTQLIVGSLWKTT